MCVITNPLPLSLLPKFAVELSQDEDLLRLLFLYQLNAGNETYNKVQEFLVKRNEDFIERQKKITPDGKFLEYIGILDSDEKLLWSTAPLSIQPKQILLYQSNYDNSAPIANHVRLFEDGLKLFGSSAGGPGIYPGSKSLFRFLVCFLECGAICS